MSSSSPDWITGNCCQPLEWSFAMKDFVNLTPHEIVIRANGPNPVDHKYPPSGMLARVNMREEPAGGIGWCPLIRRFAGEVVLPDGVGEGYLLVSSMVLDAARATNHPRLADMVAPDSGPTAIREAGQVVAVTRLVVA